MSDGGGDTGGFESGGNHNDGFNDNHNQGGGGGWGNNYYYGNDDYNNNNNYQNQNGNGRCANIMMFVLGFIFLAVGFGVGGVLTSNAVAKSNSWEEVTGSIIGRQTCSSNCSPGKTCSTTYAAVIEYVVNNSTYTFTSKSCSSPGPKVGNDIKVLYDPEEPGSAISGKFWDLWLPSIILGCFGIAGLGMLVFACKKRASNAQASAFGPTTGQGQIQASTYDHQTTNTSAPIASAPTNPYALHAQQNQQTGGNTSNAAGKPSMFDSLSGRV